MPFIFVSGILSAWMHQKKMPTILFCILLPLLFLNSNSFLYSLAWYLLGFSIFTSIPILVAIFYGSPYVKGCFCYTFTVYLIVLSIIARKLNISLIEMFLNKMKRFLGVSVQGTAYVEKNLGKHKSWKQMWMDIKTNTYLFSKDLFLILTLAALTSIGIIIHFDFNILILLCLLIIFLVLVYAQRNFYTPHFSPIWSPLSILAAKAIWDYWPSHINNKIIGWIMIAFLSLGTFKIIKIIIKTFYRSEINSLGHLDPLIGKVFRLCEPIGEYIQENSKESDKLFVWGDQPSIYLYADREAMNFNHIMIYAHNDRIVAEKELLDNLRSQPPELLIFYNYKVSDGWNMKRLQETIGIPYNHIKSFQITDNSNKKPENPQGICFDFPLFRRNDKLYKEILLDRAINAEVNNNLSEARKHLNEILEITPENFEASLRLTLLKGDNSQKEKRRYIEDCMDETNDPVNTSTLLSLLSEIDADEGNLDSAMDNLEKALALNPDNFRIYNALGTVYSSMNNVGDAAKSFNNAVGLNAYSADAYYNIAVILSQQGKHTDAIKCFDKALSIMPEHQDAVKNMESLKTV